MTDKSDKPQINPAFCTYAEFSPHFASGVKLTEPQVQAMSRAGRFPQFCRLTNSQRSVALYSRQEISNYWASTWGVTAPSAVKSLLKAGGFPAPTNYEETTRWLTRKQRAALKRKAKQKAPCND